MSVISLALPSNINLSFEDAFGGISNDEKKNRARTRFISRHGRFVVYCASRHRAHFNAESKKLAFKEFGYDYWLCELRTEYLVTCQLLGEDPLLYHLRDRNIVWKQHVGGMNGGWIGDAKRMKAYEKRRDLILEQADVMAKHLSKYKVNPLARELTRRKKCQSQKTSKESKR